MSLHPVTHTLHTAIEPQLRVALLTGGQDRHYAFGLIMALAAENVFVDVIGSDDIDSPELHTTPGIRFLNLIGSQRPAGIGSRLWRILASYARLLRYAATSRSAVFHILWNGKLQYFDRTVLMIYLRLLGRKVVLTAHNVNGARRDNKDSVLNRLTLRFQYALSHQILVHTEKMKTELSAEFGVPVARVMVIPYGMNNAVPDTGLPSQEARRRLGIAQDDRLILFFGAIKNYKGLEYLVPAFQKIAGVDPWVRLIIAGERKKGSEEYLRNIEEAIDRDSSHNRVIRKIEFIPDEETEVYFKAADVLALPYTEIFQSGILFLALSFGLPVIATQVGSFAEDVVDGVNGFVCATRSADDLAAAIRRYFASDLYRNLESHRTQIRSMTLAAHDWTVVGRMTADLYARLAPRPAVRLQHAAD